MPLPEYTPCDNCSCPKCGAKTEYRIVEDDEGHEDVHHRCTECWHSWWTDGGDA
jgi:hypothetical protein